MNCLKNRILFIYLTSNPFRWNRRSHVDAIRDYEGIEPVRDTFLFQVRTYFQMIVNVTVTGVLSMNFMQMS